MALGLSLINLLLLFLSNILTYTFFKEAVALNAFLSIPFYYGLPLLGTFFLFYISWKKLVDQNLGKLLTEIKKIQTEQQNSENKPLDFKILLDSIAGLQEYMANKNEEIQKKTFCLEEMILTRTEELRKTIDFNNNLLNSMSDLLIVTGADGMLVKVNKVAGEKLQISESEMKKLSITKLFTESDFLRINLGFAGGEHLQQTKIISTKGISFPIFLSRSFVRDQDGRVMNHLYLGRDLTQELAAEKQIESQQKVLTQQGRLVTLGTLASGLIHELSNPLMIIRTYAGRLNKLDPENWEEQVQKINSKISNSVEHIFSIIKSVRSTSRMTDKDPLVETNLAMLIEEAKSLCEVKLLGTDIKLEVENSLPQGAIKVRGGEIIQVLVNLIANSIDAISELPDKWIKIQIEEKEGKIHLRVSDSGGGISEEVRSRLFEEFFTTKEAGLGTGLGLSLSKKIIEENGGELKYDESAETTCFLIDLPKVA